MAGVIVSVLVVGLAVQFLGRGNAQSRPLPRTAAGAGDPVLRGGASITTDGAGRGQIILTKTGPGSTTYILVGWDGHVIRRFASRDVGGARGQLGQSPDGTRFVADRQVGGTVQRSIFGVDGTISGSMDRGDQFRWADDSRHLCVIHNPNPGPGQTSVLSISDLGGPPQTLDTLGQGDTSQDTLHEVAACSTHENLVVVLDETLVASNQAMRAATTSIREFSLSTHQLVKRFDLRAAPASVILSSDGKYFVEESLEAPFMNTIVRSADARTISSIPNRIVLGFTGDDSEVVVGLQTAATMTDVVEIRHVNDGSVVASFRGHMTAICFEPRSASTFLALTTQPLGPDPLGNAQLLIARVDGSAVSVHLP